jgi:Domain of unknown function (DUF4105)
VTQALHTPAKEGKRWFSFLFFVCLSVWLPEACGTSLSESNGWRAMLHFPKHATQSLIDDPTFFLSPQGRTDPSAELAASIEAFSQKPTAIDDDSPQCRFLGRYRWLQRNAPTLAKNFVAQDCQAWEKLIARVKPHSVTLVFPDGYLNSPASMFGHTLLRIDQADPQPLRSFAVNYAAQTNEENGIAYAFNGLTGEYKGYYSLMPYPEKLQEYQFGEQRDIWEYQLKLSPAETATTLEHIWELQGIYANYYFLDRNCSFQLLALIEAARPNLDLLNDWGPSVIPIDTIRRLESASLVGKSNLRPSQATQINRKLKLLSEAEIDIVQNLGNPNINAEDIDLPTDTTRRALLLDTATDYVQWERSRQSMSLEQYRLRFLYLLSQRSQIKNIKSSVNKTDATDSNDPTQGHGTKRFSASAIQQGSTHAVGLSYRPAFHDMRDRENGYRPGAGISFLEVNARWDRNQDKLKIDTFDLLKIESLAPRNALLKPYSWRVNVGAKRVNPLDMNSPLQAFVSAGAGPTYRLNQGHWLIFASAEALLSKDRVDNKTFTDVGWRLGTQWRPNDHVSMTFTAHDWLNTTPYTKADRLAQLDLAYYLDKDQSIQLQRKASLGKSEKSPIHSLTWNWFY